MPNCGQALLGDVKELLPIPPDFLKHPACAVPLQALRLLKRRYGADIAVVGKVFGPWTLGYHVYGIENFLMASLDEPDNVKRAMRRLMEVTLGFATAQLEAGADALCLADHCTRDLCSPATYRDLLLEFHQQLHEQIPCPILLHICGHTADRIPFIRSTGIECFHFDSDVPSAQARELAGDRLALMGGTSNLAVVLHGTPASITKDIEEKLANKIDILGPECAVPLDAPCKNLRYFTAEAKRLCAARSLSQTMISASPVSGHMLA
jgi:[methyl-Co(III) methanol-specific corrinoid protein]:coenzyme M methyltransferase